MFVNYVNDANEFNLPFRVAPMNNQTHLIIIPLNSYL
jgi:hypothetical protein